MTVHLAFFPLPIIFIFVYPIYYPPPAGTRTSYPFPIPCPPFPFLLPLSVLLAIAHLAFIDPKLVSYFMNLIVIWFARSVPIDWCFTIDYLSRTIICVSYVLLEFR